MIRVITVRLAGDEVEQFHEDRNELDWARENTEHELLLTGTSLTRTTEAPAAGWSANGEAQS
ncbi:hypothetical protein PF003_g13696 [Phytophthora fragariae]|nr:hypothetical protein PF003_g13696 [Phytophthora fragariae]